MKTKDLVSSMQVDLSGEYEFTSKKRVLVHVYIRNTTPNTFYMGNSSFLVNYNKLALKNPKLVFKAQKYSSEGYMDMRIETYPTNMFFGVQIQLYGGDARTITDKKIKLFSVSLERTIAELSPNFKWRKQDTGVVTPGMIDIQINYIDFQFKK